MGAKIAAAASRIVALFEGQIRASVAVAQDPDPAAGPTLLTSPSSPDTSHPAAPPPPQTGTIVLSEKRGRLVAFLGDDVTVLYRDVPIDAWYAPYVAELATEGIAQGYKDAEGKLTGVFGVQDPVKRDEALKMVLEAGGNKPSVKPPRNASAQGTWAAGYVRLAEEKGMTVYTPDADINAAATRGEVMQILLEALGFPIADQAAAFSDVPARHPFGNAIATAAFYGLVTDDTDYEGHPLGTFRPDDEMNRVEVAKVIALARGVVRR